MSSLRHWVWLSTRGPAPGMYAARILHHFGPPEGAYFAGREELQACPGLPEKVRQALEDKDLSQADQILAQCEALGIWVLTCQDASTPWAMPLTTRAPCRAKSSPSRPAAMIP